MNRLTRDPLQGKEVMITGGQYKGYRGKVCKIDDRQAIVELSSVCKKIPIDRDLIKDLKAMMDKVGGSSTRNGDDDAFTQGGRTVYEAGKTPMQYNTPSYYPQSPHWGANSPGFGTECKFDLLNNSLQIMVTCLLLFQDLAVSTNMEMAPDSQDPTKTIGLNQSNESDYQSCMLKPADY